MERQKKITIILVVILAISVLANIFLLTRQKTASTSQDFSQKYPLLSPRLSVDNPNDVLINFTSLRSAMQSYIDKQPETVGVYFEYLPSGVSIGINDKTEQKIASLIKVPVVMAAYKAVENGKLDLNKELTVSQNDLDRSFGSLWREGAGKKITVDEAINKILMESDNTAVRTLIREVPEYGINDVFNSLDIPKERDSGIPVISPKSYSSILRSLYLSSYLRQENSQEILDTLTKTNFNDKLPAGVPNGVPVAHKIGVFNSNDQQPLFSDCGIVYVPSRPYIICVMTSGADEEKAREHMQLLSKMVYGFVEKVN